MARPKPEDASEDAKKIVDDAKNFIEKAIADIGKTSATKQLILGTASGWITGFMTMKLGKLAAFGIGGGVILLHVANQKGYIDINWDKINKKVDKVTDKIEKQATGKSPDWMEKVLLFVKNNSYYSAGFTGGFFFDVERFVDRKLDKAEDIIKKKEIKAKRWFGNIRGDDHYRATETHVFLASFVAGLAVGIICGK